MKSVVILSLLLVGVFSSTLNQNLMLDLFKQWKLTHNKVYYTALEEAQRFTIFGNNYLEILKINSMQDDVVLGLNKFADLTNEEFTTMYTGELPELQEDVPVAELTVSDLPEKVDWREKGAVTPVQNQGKCGSCWAFAAVAGLESLHFLKTGNLLKFSEQLYVDCVTSCYGCNGGLAFEAYAYSVSKGVQLESDYPYTAVDGMCVYDASKAIHVNNGFVRIPTKNLEATKQAIVQQPITVSIQANQPVFQFYKMGVIKTLCGDSLNHAVFAVGYDNISGSEAYIIRNSWGDTWGQKGYVFIATDPEANKGNGVCGILVRPGYPTKN